MIKELKLRSKGGEEEINDLDIQEGDSDSLLVATCDDSG